MRACRRAWSIVLIGFVAAGCSAGGYNAGALRGRLVDAGLTPTEATCVLHKLVKQFGTPRLSSHAAATAAEIARAKAFARACGAATTKR